MWPAKQPTITGVDLYYEKVGDPCFRPYEEVNNKTDVSTAQKSRCSEISDNLNGSMRKKHLEAHLLAPDSLNSEDQEVKLQKAPDNSLYSKVRLPLRFPPPLQSC